MPAVSVEPYFPGFVIADRSGRETLYRGRRGNWKRLARDAAASVFRTREDAERAAREVVAERVS